MKVTVSDILQQSALLSPEEQQELSVKVIEIALRNAVSDDARKSLEALLAEQSDAVREQTDSPSAIPPFK